MHCPQNSKNDDFIDTILGEDMVFPFHTLIKPKALEQGA
jgi:hypothetical protein